MQVVSKHHARVIQQQFNISASHEEAICGLLRERTGIVIQNHQLRSLHDTLVAACQHFGYPDLNAYLEALFLADNLSPEFELLVAGITVGESYFFRDEHRCSFSARFSFPNLFHADVLKVIWN
jgi:chemotaxis protein methyltransferase CheR